jgi:hypothetical protein
MKVKVNFMNNECKEENCSRKSVSRGWCGPHYKNYWRHGNPIGKFIRCSNDMPIQDRLNAKSKINNETGCIEWTGTINPQTGYGGIRFNGKKFSCHRVSWEINNNKSANGKVIMHLCDNKKCINPNHLIVGTQTDNMKDKVTKNRQLKGEQVYGSKLTEKDVKNIIILNRKGKSQSELGRMYNITASAIGNICRRKRWKHVEIQE